MTGIKLFEHPQYAARAGLWQELADLYQGDHATLSTNSGYLWTHEIEKRADKGKELREIRELRSRYFNLMEPAVDRWVSFLFKKIDLTQIEQAIPKEEQADITGTGVSLEDFIKDYIGRNLVLYGRPIVRIDAYPNPAETLLEARQRGERPYLELVSPLAAKDWTIAPKSNRSQFVNFRSEYVLLEPRADLRSEPVEVIYSREEYLVGDDVIVRLAKKDKAGAEWSDAGQEAISGLGFLPVYSIESEDSWVKQGKEQQILLYNYCSTESCIINAQAFQRIIIAGNLRERDKLEMGIYLATFVPEGSQVTAIEPANTEPVVSAIERTVDRFFKSAFNQVYTLASGSNEAMAADSQREMKDEFITAIQSAVGKIEDLVNRIVQGYAAFKGMADFEGQVKIEGNTTHEDVDREIRIWQAHRDDFVKLAKTRKAILKKRIDDLNLPNADECKDEVEAADLSSGATLDTSALRAEILGANDDDAGTTQSNETN